MHHVIDIIVTHNTYELRTTVWHKKINSMKYVGLRVSKVPSSDWKLKLLPWFNIILYSEMCFQESVTILPLSLRLHRC